MKEVPHFACSSSKSNINKFNRLTNHNNNNKYKSSNKFSTKFFVSLSKPLYHFSRESRTSSRNAMTYSWNRKNNMCARISIDYFCISGGRLIKQFAEITYEWNYCPGLVDLLFWHIEVYLGSWCQSEFNRNVDWKWELKVCRNLWMWYRSRKRERKRMRIWNGKMKECVCWNIHWLKTRSNISVARFPIATKHTNGFMFRFPCSHESCIHADPNECVELMNNFLGTGSKLHYAIKQSTKSCTRWIAILHEILRES